MGASLLLAVNLTLGFTIAGILAGVVIFDRSMKHAYWWLASCVTAIFAGALMYALPLFEDFGPVRATMFGLFAVSNTLLGMGLAVRYGGRGAWRPFLAVLLASMVVYVVATEYISDLAVRRAIYQLPFAGIQLIGLAYVVRGMGRHFIDRGVAAVLVISVLQFPAKSLLALYHSGAARTPEELLASTYAAGALAITAITWILLTVLLGVRMIADIVDRMRARSELDQLSGLLNRQGFVSKVEALNSSPEAAAVPACLVLCDLDHFKQINDTFGHAAGDRVITAFGEAIAAMARDSDIAARIGGEEFCVLLRNTDIIGAHLFAEALRSVFTNSEVTGLPEEKSLTASFGVTEIETGEPFEKALSRADAALYDAKHAGRDRVAIRSAEDGLEDQPVARSAARMVGE